MTEYIAKLRATIQERREALGGDTYAHANWVDKRRMTRVCVHVEQLEHLLDVYEAAIAYGQSRHIRTVGCFAGECEHCPARDALDKLQSLVGDPWEQK